MQTNDQLYEDEQDLKILEHDQLIKKNEDILKDSSEKLNQLLESIGLDDKAIDRLTKREHLSPQIWQALCEHKLELESMINDRPRPIYSVEKKQRAFKELSKIKNWMRI